jgi:hypothetical protein
MWTACHDSNEALKTQAQAMWQQFSFELPANFCALLAPLLSVRDQLYLRKAVGRALAGACQESGDNSVAAVRSTLDAMIALFRASPDVVIEHDFRRGTEIVSKAHVREGVTHTLAGLVPVLEHDSVKTLFQFLTDDGLQETSEVCRQPLFS